MINRWERLEIGKANLTRISLLAKDVSWLSNLFSTDIARDVVED
jgi:hypothetical protein